MNGDPSCCPHCLGNSLMIPGRLSNMKLVDNGRIKVTSVLAYLVGGFNALPQSPQKGEIAWWSKMNTEKHVLEIINQMMADVPFIPILLALSKNVSRYIPRRPQLALNSYFRLFTSVDSYQWPFLSIINQCSQSWTVVSIILKVLDVQATSIDKCVFDPSTSISHPTPPLSDVEATSINHPDKTSLVVSTSMKIWVDQLTIPRIEEEKQMSI